MFSMLAPVFAQVVALQVQDRTEVRYVKDRVERYEGTNVPAVSLHVVARRTTLSLAYLPQLTVLPLERGPRDLLVFHVLTANASHRLDRRTTLSFNNTLGIGTVNFRVFAQQGQGATIGLPPTGSVEMPGAPVPGAPPVTGTPTTPGSPQPSPGTVNRPDVTDRRISYYTATSTLAVAHQATKRLLLSAQGSFTAAGGRGASVDFYTPLRAVTFGGAGTYVYPVATRDSLSSNLSLLKTYSSRGNEAATANATETWTRRYGERTTSFVTGGINVTRFSQSTGLRGFSIFPTANLGVTHQWQLRRGQVFFTVSAYSAPILDPLRALVDPRVGATGTIGYTRDKLGVVGSGNSAFSIAPDSNRAGSVDSYLAEARMFYGLGDLVQVDLGARTTRQAYQGVTVVPTSWVAFVGLTFGYRAYLAGNPPPAEGHAPKQL